MNYFSGSNIRRAWTCAASDGVPRRSLLVAIIVGTILNVINQGDVLLAHESIDWLKVALTFLVPYGVATYGAVSLQLGRASRNQSDKQGDLGKHAKQTKECDDRFGAS